MIGGGTYSLPQNMAAGASVGAVLLAWLITGIGVIFWRIRFAFCRCQTGFDGGHLYVQPGQVSARMSALPSGGLYWLCQICGNVGYAVITMDALNYFFPPYFAGGNGIYSIIGGSR